MVATSTRAQEGVGRKPGYVRFGSCVTAPWQELSEAVAALVGCGHVSRLFVRR